MNWRQRKVGAGLLLACLGILLVLAGALHNRNSGFSYHARLVEGEVTVLPSVPFVVRLERSDQEFGSPAGRHRGDDGASSPIQFSLLRNGQVFEQITTGPDHPVDVEGFTLSPLASESGWAFDLAVEDPGGRGKVVPVEPWDPPLIRLGLTRQHVFADRVSIIGNGQSAGSATARPNAAEIFLIEDNGDRQSLGYATATEPVSASGYMVSVWRVRPYIGLYVYRHPGFPLLVAGILCLLAGAATAGIALGASGRRKAGDGEVSGDRRV